MEEERWRRRGGGEVEEKRAVRLYANASCGEVVAPEKENCNEGGERRWRGD